MESQNQTMIDHYFQLITQLIEHFVNTTQDPYGIFVPIIDKFNAAIETIEEHIKYISTIILPSWTAKQRYVQYGKNSQLWLQICDQMYIYSFLSKFICVFTFSDTPTWQCQLEISNLSYAN